MNESMQGLPEARQARYIYEVARDPFSCQVSYTRFLDALKTQQQQQQILESSVTSNHNVALLSYLNSIFSKEDTANSNTTSTNNSTNNSTRTTNCTTTQNKSASPEFNYQQQLEESYNNLNDNTSSANNDPTLELQRLAMAHNIALTALIQNDPNKGVNTLLPLFLQFNTESNRNKMKNTATFTSHVTVQDLRCKVAFLLLDCILAHGDELLVVDHTTSIISWIEYYINHYPTSDSSSNQMKNDTASFVTESTTELKFRLHCYKSKLLFHQIQQYQGQQLPQNHAHPSNNNNKDTKLEQQQQQQQSTNTIQRDKNTRLARKELKSAMEIYHHKLAKKDRCGGTNDGNGSSSSTANNNNNNNNNINTSHHTHNKVATTVGTTTSVSAYSRGSTDVDGGASLQESVGSILSQDGTTAGTTTTNSNNNHASNNGTANSSNGQPMPTHIRSTTTAEVSTSQGEMTSTTTTPSGAGSGGVDSRLPYQLKKMDGQNQSVLYLKANLEYLKGNAKKSLKLCQEAQNSGKKQREHVGNLPASYPTNGAATTTTGTTTTATTSSSSTSTTTTTTTTPSLDKSDMESQRMSDLQAAMYYNNLAMIQQVSGKVNLALHYYACSISHLERVEHQSTAGVETDGTASQVPTCQVLYNAALCAQQATKYIVAYECLTRCVNCSPNVFCKDPRCWLHLAENCIGIHSTHKQQNHMPDPSEEEKKKHDLGSEADLQSIDKYPLSRAFECLNQCLLLCQKKYASSKLHFDCMESAQVSLAYVCIELNNPAAVVRLADILFESLSTARGESSGDNDGNESARTNNTSTFTPSSRNVATMRMYACEASCILGYPSKAIEYLVGKTTNDTSSEINMKMEEIGKDLMPRYQSMDSTVTDHHGVNDGKKWFELINHIRVSIQSSLEDAGAPSNVNNSHVNFQ